MCLSNVFYISGFCRKTTIFVKEVEESICIDSIGRKIINGNTKKVLTPTPRNSLWYTYMGGNDHDDSK